MSADSTPRNMDHYQEQEEKAAFIPTLEQIKRGCQKIRRTWSEEEHRRRSIYYGQSLIARIYKTPPKLVWPDRNPFN